MKIKLSTVALAALLFAGLPLASSSAYIGISVGFAPPAIPIYEQPYCPREGYIWVPGYWAWDGFDYYWVPGFWAAPPRVEFYWTPGYWGYDGGRYVFNDGYWALALGSYGGINYGYGYGGRGYYGGEWVGSTFRYNTAVTRVDTTVIRNTYVNNNCVTATNTRTSFNGPGGVTATATAQELAAAKAEHIKATKTQKSLVQAAKKDPALHAKNNHGTPKAEAIKAVERKSGVQTAAAAGGVAGAKKQAGIGKAKGATNQGANGNSAFGQKQGDATTRTKGSQNNAYGKARSADAQASHQTKKLLAPRKRRRHARPQSRGDEIRSARQQRADGHRAAERPQLMSRRQQPAQIRHAAPAKTDRAKGPAATQSDKKKKRPANEGPGHGR